MLNDDTLDPDAKYSLSGNEYGDYPDLNKLLNDPNPFMDAHQDKVHENSPSPPLLRESDSATFNTKEDKACPKCGCYYDHKILTVTPMGDGYNDIEVQCNVCKWVSTLKKCYLASYSKAGSTETGQQVEVPFNISFETCKDEDKSTEEADLNSREVSELYNTDHIDPNEENPVDNKIDPNVVANLQKWADEVQKREPPTPSQ